jgi:hypothetical protein
MKLNWKHSSQHPIAYVSYSSGFLIRVEFDLDRKHWQIELLNGLVVVTRDRAITQIEDVKTMAEGLLCSALKDIGRAYGTE